MTPEAIRKRLEGGVRGRIKANIQRRAEKAEGMDYARQWRERHPEVDWNAVDLSESEGVPLTVIRQIGGPRGGNAEWVKARPVLRSSEGGQ